MSKSTKTRPPNVFLFLGKAPWIRRLTKLHTVRGLQTAGMDGHCISSLSTRTSCACDAGSKGCDCVLQVSSMVFFSSSYPGTLSRGSAQQAASAHTHKHTLALGSQQAGQVDLNQPDGVVGSGGALGRTKKKRVVATVTAGARGDGMGNPIVRFPFLPAKADAGFPSLLLCCWPGPWLGLCLLHMAIPYFQRSLRTPALAQTAQPILQVFL